MITPISGLQAHRHVSTAISDSTATGRAIMTAANAAAAATAAGVGATDTPTHAGMLLTPGTEPAHVEGKIYWDSTDHTLSLMSEISGSVLQVGQENWIRIVNKTGSTIANGTVVYLSGAQGNRPTVTSAIATSAASDSTIGVATSSIANNAEGYVTTFGLVRGINTSGWTAGDTLWLSASTAGALTNVEPSAPDHAVRVGYALNSTVSGSILVSVATGFELSDLHDVLVSAPAAGHTLRWDGAKWVNAVPSASDLTAGTLPDARLSANVPRLDTAQTWTAVQDIHAASTPFRAWVDGVYTTGNSTVGDYEEIGRFGDGRGGNGSHRLAFFRRRGPGPGGGTGWELSQFGIGRVVDATWFGSLRFGSDNTHDHIVASCGAFGVGVEPQVGAGLIQVAGAVRVVPVTVASLPTPGHAGRHHFASNGRKAGEGAGAGTGVLCYDDGTAWRRCSDDTTVAA